MVRIALDLTEEEMKSYKLGTKFIKHHDEKRREQALELARNIANILRKDFGASKVVVFGSIVSRDSFTDRSDIDIAVYGIKAVQFYQAAAAATSISSDFHVDLVDPEDCRPSISQVIEEDGIEI